ncbi:putative ORFan [Tupanvirus deep ocean]|uniref:ORFan n=2 Tax=Tupanvirus TaxID=2094720 RepID=A0AC62A912_9VIRU|nr:putative ORFan [Tupanvirus deep ocean]QKU34158.1 putative ORFan [Tupanvirus deep ocean]
MNSIRTFEVSSLASIASIVVWTTMPPAVISAISPVICENIYEISYHEYLVKTRKPKTNLHDELLLVTSIIKKKIDLGTSKKITSKKIILDAEKLFETEELCNILRAMTTNDFMNSTPYQKFFNYYTMKLKERNPNLNYREYKTIAEKKWNSIKKYSTLTREKLQKEIDNLEVVVSRIGLLNYNNTKCRIWCT